VKAIKNASELYEWQQQIKAATGRDDVSCVIGAWMAGIPSASTLDRVAADYRTVVRDEVSIKNLLHNLFYSPGTALGSLIGNKVYGDDLYTLEDACASGLGLDAALSLLKDADADLWRRVTQTGELQRAEVAHQANATARENLGRDVLDAGKYVFDGLDQLTGLVTAAKVGIGLGIAWLFTRWLGR